MTKEFVTKLQDWKSRVLIPPSKMKKLMDEFNLFKNNKSA